ncbi:GNAT family N-acetyltransferase [Oerskovia enterophila]|uniref:N-acetyltransferase YafP n=1 Tax=Oerskovia enterophila TaxID=43678 RepID=A0A163QEG5_9CELL|nr:GNAT family N-acetyltransferase [Oerskovia enterophila]KZM34081.1 putative N-acetyltransferase YafP [Oerskovia enterophila]OCI31839.1 putative N-acetyltransferase YafP [Oerskovia enterophila]
MILRAYDESDAEATLRVFLRAVRVTASKDYSPEQIAAWGSDDISLDVWAVKRLQTDTVVAVEGDEVLGFSDVDDRGYVDMMFVDPTVTRRGVASALLDHVTRMAREHGAVELTTYASLTARPFFEKHGFVVVEERQPVLRGVSLTNFRMRKPLA